MNKPLHFLEEDKELIKGCIKGDRASQNRLYKKYARIMLLVCYRYSKDKEDAKDTLSEGFMKVFENIKAFNHTGSFEGWMKRIMINTALDKFKKKSNLFKVVSFDDVKSLSTISDTDILGELNTKELISLIQKLPPAYQLVFNLYVFEGLKHKEIAEKLNVSEGTSKSNLSDARKWLKKGIEDLYFEKKAVNE